MIQYKSQKDRFLEAEGDAWFERNRVSVSQRDYESNDLVARAVLRCLALESHIRRPDSNRNKILEIGCGEGSRLAWLKENSLSDCYGIDPSKRAISEAREKGVRAEVGTADSLPFSDNFFDIVIFGFCLYLCDRDDLFTVAREANRVLKGSSWVIIQDFFSNSDFRNHYAHSEGIYSFKMDYRKLFDWHPNYSCISHEVFSHDALRFTDDKGEWVSTSVIRKYADFE